MQKKIAFQLLLLALVGALPLHSRATVITFDDITTSTEFPADYYGLSWTGDNHRILNTTTYSNQLSGYVAGTVSPDNVAIYRNNATITSLSGTFDFNGAYLTAGWHNGLDVLVEGKLGGSTVFTKNLVLDTTAAVWHNFDWMGIDELTFASSGGTNAFLGGSGAWTAIDNFTINASAVPVPAAVWLFGSGLLGLVAVGRRKQV